MVKFAFFPGIQTSQSADKKIFIFLALEVNEFHIEMLIQLSS